MKKFLSKVKSIANRSKVAVVAAVAAVSSAVVSVCASAATNEASGASGNDMSTLLSSAGEQLQKSFSDLVMTLIPVVMGILGSALVIFGIMALVKFGKKIFRNVAG